MNCLPLISRELRAGSRRWTTYWLRLLAAAAVMGGVLFWLAMGNPSRRAGGEMFELLHQIILGAIWILVPLMTCDCLSQEKREGTLGLLFLTNLKATEIVLAKAIAHGVRALTLWLAIIPIIAVPLLMGGLSWKEVLLSCSVTFASLCMAVTVGLLASALSRRINGAVGLAVALTVIIHLVLLITVSMAFGTCLVLGGAIPSQMFFQDVRSEALNIGLAVLWNTEGEWHQFFSSANAAAPWVSWATTALLLLAPVAFVFLIAASIFLVAPVIRRNWQDKPKTKRQEEVDNILFKPVFWIGFFNRWMRRSLERNPIGWLEKRSWHGRTTAWVWLAVMVSLSTGLAYGTTGYSSEDIEVFNVLMWMLLGTIAFVAAGSFRRERETGALELILITPMSERQIISGRLRGLWTQFLPSAAIWLAVVIYLSSWQRGWRPGELAFWAVSYLAVPIVGLYFSLRSRFVLLSWLATLAACFGAPYFLWLLWYWCMFAFWGDIYDPLLEKMTHSLIVVLPVQSALAALLIWRLHVNLRRRSFSFR